MKVAIIGAGFGGLAAAYKLAKSGIDVTIFESEEYPGGLAVGFEHKDWKWSLEKHYHHWFESDLSIRALAKEVGQEVIFKPTKTSTFIGGESYELDSPLSLLTFSKLPLSERIRTGLVLGYLKYVSSWKDLEKVTAHEFLSKYMGEVSWKVLWRPLFEKKFNQYSNEISAAWFWARIKSRSKNLGYPAGGFLTFAKVLDKKLRKLGVKIKYKSLVEAIYREDSNIILAVNHKKYEFDKVVSTLPSYPFTKITRGLPDLYKESLLSLRGIGAVNLVLSLNKSYLEDGTYWLNVNEPHFPFLAVVEHTNFMDQKYYNNEHLIYIGNYLPNDHQFFRSEAVDLLRNFYPYLKTINPKFDKSWINKAYVFKAPFAQPIIPLNYSKILPDFKTPVEGLYLCNIQQVYPWDRGTNYAVENGEKVAQLLLESQ